MTQTDSPIQTTDIITPEEAKTLSGLFQARVQRNPDKTAYHYFDNASQTWRDLSWGEMARAVGRWQAAMAALALQPGDRVAIMANSCPDWVTFDQAALGLGLVVVPLFANDRAESVDYILRDSGAKLLVISGAQHWSTVKTVCETLSGQLQVWSLTKVDDPGLHCIQDLLPSTNPPPQCLDLDPDTLATIVYTSGTTGRPKGVMLNHRNILWNAHAGLQIVPAYPDDLFLSFLPLSHTLERTVGYYLPMMSGAAVAYARSIPQLAEDLATVRPTVMISVPRIYERTYNRIQENLTSPVKRGLFNMTVAVGWRRFLYRQGRAAWSPGLLLWPLLRRLVAGKILARLGGRLRIAICGGAPLSFQIGKTFIGLGLDLLQGYGLTESSPVIAVNASADNEPASVGPPLPGAEIKTNAQDELLTRSPGVMLGYWNNPQASAEMIDSDGWLHTGDKVRIANSGHIFVTGRIKDIIVLANGEKVAPADMEEAITADPLFEQAMVLGDGRPFLSALVVINTDRHPADIAMDDEKALLERLSRQLHAFPGYAQVRRLAISAEPWTVENGLLTPTLKVRRAQVLHQHAAMVEKLYEGH